MQQQQRLSFRAFAASVMRDPAGGATAQSRWAVLEAELIDYFQDASWKKSLLDRVHAAVCPRPRALQFDATQGALQT